MEQDFRGKKARVVKQMSASSSSLTSSSSSLWWERCKHRPINGKILVLMTFLSVVAMIVASSYSSSSSSSFSLLFFPTGRGEDGEGDDDASTMTIPVAREELEEVLREEKDAS
jgi:hypothetical protein